MPSDQAVLDERMRAVAAALEEAAGRPEACAAVDGEALQELLAAVTRLFAARQEAGDALEAFAPDGPVAPPTPTDVVVTVSAMLESASIELIELGLWQTWGATRRQSDES